jgi:hypothetical protein
MPQIPASPVHKLSQTLVEQLSKMLQELLHDSLIVPSTSPFFAAPLLGQETGWGLLNLY